MQTVPHQTTQVVMRNWSLSFLQELTLVEELNLVERRGPAQVLQPMGLILSSQILAIPEEQVKEKILLIPIIQVVESLAPSKVVTAANKEEVVVEKDPGVEISLPLV